MVHGCAEVEVFNVEAQISRVFCADDTVPQHFGGGEIGSLCGEFSRIFNEIPPGCKSHVIRI